MKSLERADLLFLVVALGAFGCAGNASGGVDESVYDDVSADDVTGIVGDDAGRAEERASDDETTPGGSARGGSAGDEGATGTDEGSATSGGAAAGGAETYSDPDDAPYDLGTPPSEVRVEWPERPVITREVEATTLAEANEAAAVAGTRVHITGALAGDLAIRASDVEIELAPGASAGAVHIGKALERVTVRGGSLEHVEIELPAEFEGELQYRPELMTTDVLIDAVQVDAADTAFLMRAGKRIAITNSRAHAGRYSVWFGDSGDFESEDVILAGNEFTSAGPEATVRLVHVVRSATVDNRLENGAKHNYRTHGRADLNWASGNVLINSGIMLGTMETDSIGRQWFENNTFHHQMPSLVEIHLDESPSVVLRRNTIYTDVWTCFLCREAPDGWVDEGNRVFPYQPPPAR